MKMSFGRLALSLVSVFVLSIASTVLAQNLDDVTISGKLTDPNGLPVAGASVTASSAETGFERTITSDDDGKYRFVALKPGVYKVKAVGSGFGIQETGDLTTIAAQNLQLDFTLRPADVRAEQTVTVSEEDAPVVDTTRTVVGGTITEREVEELPNESRNPLDLVLTLGGTAEEQLSTRDLAEDRGARGLSTPGTTPEEAGIFGLSGGAAYSNNITIDGLDNNDDRGATFRFQPSTEAVSEVQVITNQFSAEYGRASGGRVNIATRKGSNRFRGRAFYFFRDESLNANTWNNNRRGYSIPAFQDNNPGFTFGGPILKNKLFFFSAYEYDNIREDTILDAWVLTNGAANPVFSLPAPNDPTAPVVTLPPSAGFPSVQVGHYLTPTATPAKKHIFSQRVDWVLSGKHNFTFSYQLGRSNDLRAFSGTNRIADSLIGRVRNTDAFNVSHNYVVTPKLVNQLRFQYSTLDPSSAQSSGALSPAVLVTFTPPGENSQTQVFGSTTSSSDRQEKRWQIQDTMNYVQGPRTWSFGVDYQNVDTTFIDRFDATGTYTFGSFVFFAANSPSRLQQNFNTTSNLKNHYVGLFVQNDWRVLSNLTINTGLRYERETVIDDNNNWGPRFAVAWNPFKNSEKTVIRFGAGIFYNRVLLRTVDDYTSDSQSVRLDTNSLNVPAGISVDLSRVRAFLGTQFPNGLTLDTIIPVNATNSYPVSQLARPSSVFRSLSPDLVIPESYQFNLGFEREISKGWKFETNLTYNKTSHLWRETNPNAPVLPEGLSDVNGDGQVSYTDYLLGITTGPNRFFQGSLTDTVGTHTSASDVAPACTTSTPICFVNVNTRNSNSSTSCSTTTTTNTPVCRAFAAVNGLRPFFSSLGPVQLEEVAPIGNSEYIGAIFELRSRYRKFAGGFAGGVRLAYTLSRLMDDGIVNTSDPTVPGDFSREWSRSLADRTHRIAFTATFDTPYWLGKLRFSPLFRYGSSAPFNVSAGGIDRSLDDLSNDRPNFAGDLTDINWRVFGTEFPQALADRFTLAPIGSPGNLPRNAGHGPSLYQFNLAVTREFKFGERVRLRPTAEFTNILNMDIFSFGSNFINFDFLNSTNPTTVQTAKDGFLAPTRTMTPRRIRLGMRFDF